MNRLCSCLHALALVVLVVVEAFGASDQPPEPSDFNPSQRWTEIATTAHVTAVAYGNGRYFAGTDFGTYLDSVDSATWKHLPSLSQTGSMNALIFAQGKWVAVGARGQIHTSTDGLSWTSQWSGTDSHLFSVTYSNDQFMAVGGQSSPRARTILTSSDAVRWTVRELSIGQATLLKVLNEQGLFVAVGNLGTLLTSTDGRVWRSITNLTRDRLSGIAFGNGQFIVLGDGGIFASTNGITWSTNRQGTMNLFDVAFGAGRFVATGDKSYVWTSTNGLNWTRTQTGSPWPLAVITHGENGFVAGGQNGAIAVSTDGVRWETHASGTAKLFSQIALGQGRMVAINDGVLYTSGNGSTWLPPTKLLPYQLYNVSFVGGRFIALGLDRSNPTRQILADSPDGLVWSLKQFELESTPADVAFGNGLYVGVRNHFFVSNDGRNWTITGAPVAGPLGGLTFGNSTFVTVKDSQVYSSTNGTIWSIQELPESGLVDVVYGNGVFVGVGNNYSRGTTFAAVSIDGMTWTIHALPQAPNRSRSSIASIAFGGGWFVAVGEGGMILSSQDGSTWNATDSGSLSSLSSVEYDGRRFITVGNEGTVLQSDILPQLRIYRSNPSGISLVVEGNPNEIFAIESTTLLGAQPWKELGRTTNSISESLFLDSDTSEPNRFYRLISNPKAR